MKNLTKKQLEVINRIENILSISILQNCSYLRNNVIKCSTGMDQERQMHYINYLNRSLQPYDFCRVESNGGLGIAIIIK
jgi:hypothetical protein